MVFGVLVIAWLVQSTPSALNEFDCPSCDAAELICAEMVRFGGAVESICTDTPEGMNFKCVCNGIQETAPEFREISPGKCLLSTGNFPPSPHSPLGLTCTKCTTSSGIDAECQGVECANGCCVAGKCQCWNTNLLGHWQGPDCTSCLPQWSLPDCKEKSLTLTAIFGGTPSALPAIIPFFVVTYIYLCFTGCRRRWSHEQPPTTRPDAAEAFSETMEERLRKLHLVDENSAMYIPPRHPKSKGIVKKRSLRHRKPPG